jgi:uncharacterized membrane protein
MSPLRKLIHSMQNNRRLSATLLLLAAWLLLSQRLAGSSFWLDEILTYRRSILPTWQAYYGSLADQAPLYQWVFLHPWLKSGTQDFWVRLPGIFMGIVTVTLTYSLGSRVGYPRAGRWAAIFLALSPLFVQHVREVRPYALLALTVTLALYSWWRALNTRRVFHWAAYALFGAAGLYSHYYAGFALAGLALNTLLLAVTAVLSWGQMRQLLLANLGIALLFAPWLPTFIGQMMSGSHSWIPPLNLRSLFEFPANFFAHPFFPDAIWLVISAITWLLLAGILSRTIRSQRDGQVALAAWLGLFLSTLAIVLVISMRKPLLVPRYFIGLAPILALLAGIMMDWALTRRQHAYLVLLIPLLLASGYSTARLTYQDRTPDWRSAAAYIEQNAQPGDRVIFFAGSAAGWHLPLQRYLAQSIEIIPNPATLENGEAITEAATLQAPSPRLWLVQSARLTPSQSVDYQPAASYGPYHLAHREIVDERAMKPHLAIDIWLLALEQPD